MSQKLIFHKQRLFAPMLCTFGGGSARGFNPGGGGGGSFSLNINGNDIDSEGVSGYTFFTKTTLGDTTMIVPSDTGITSLRLELRGGSGGYNGKGGAGATVIVTADLTQSTFAGNTFYFVNAGKGQTGGSNYRSPGGYNGGGKGVDNSPSAGSTGSGGGATDMRTTNPSGDPTDDYGNAGRILVAGGGGGGTGNSPAEGGAGGYPEGGNSPIYNGGRGYGGTQSSGGSYGGSFGQGGTNEQNTGWNGGGGGGWYGGGAHNTQHGGGGGGSSYSSSDFTVVSRTSNSSSSHIGAGYLKISLS